MFRTEFLFDGRSFVFHHEDEHDHIFRHLRNTETFYQQEFLNYVREFIRPGDLVLDVGANIGTHSVFFAAICGARVIAFEPNPAAQTLFDANVEANGLRNQIKLEPFGVGAAESRASLEGMLDHNLGATRLLVGKGGISIRPLDTIALSSPPRLIKVDVEGAELEVLEGAWQLITKARPILTLEATTEAELVRIRNKLEPLGYVGVQTLNYTPTIVFVPCEEDAIARQTALMASNALSALRYLVRAIDKTERKILDGQRQQTTALLSALPETPNQQIVEKSVAALEASRSVLERLLLTHREAILEEARRFGDVLTDFHEQSNRETLKVNAVLQDIRKYFKNTLDTLSHKIDNEQRFELLQTKLESAVKDLKDLFDVYNKKLIDQITRKSDETVGLVLDKSPFLRESIGFNDRHRTDDIEMQLFGLRSDVDDIRASLRGSLERLELLVTAQAAAAVVELAPVVPVPITVPARLAEEAKELDGSLICFYARHFCEGWSDWRFEQSLQLDAGGGFIVNQATGTPGLRSAAIALPGNGLYRVDVRWRLQPGAEMGAWIVRVSDPESGELLHSDTPIADGAFSVYFYVPYRISAVEIGVLSSTPEIGFKGRIDEVRLSKADEARFQERISKSIGAPVIASLASLPGRVSMMQDAVASLLLQCDEVRIFLNGYTEVPAFLDHPRVTVRRSQDYDDNGDAGKFHWVEAEDPPGYRIIGDDDLLYPPDLAQRLVARIQENGNRVMVGLHGILIRQPLTEYYSPNSRHVVHFQSALCESKLVHVLATCVMGAHSTLLPRKFATFMHRNMADTWISKYAKEKSIPLIAVERESNWVRENKQNYSYDTIYENSTNRTSSIFDTSLIQSAVLKAAWPLTTPKFGRNIGLMILQIADVAELQEDVRRFHATRRQDHDWKTVIVLVSKDPAQRAALEAAPFSEELHIIATSSHEAATAELGRLLPRLIFDVGYYKGYGLNLVRDDWCHDVVELARSYDIASAGFRLEGNNFRPVMSEEAADFAFFSPARCGGPPPSDGHELIARLLSASVATTREALIPSCWPPTPETARGRRPARLCDFFDRVVVLNLDRRPERFARMRTQLAELGINPVRQRAVDGAWPEVRAAHLAYFVQDLRDVEALPRLNTAEDFYLHAVSEAQRIAYVEQKAGRKAIATPGAWGYLHSHIRILEQAIADGVENLLVLDDDVTFHRDASDLFESAVAELPGDWKILQLGSLQYDWDSRYVRWRSRHLYSQRGAAIGSHAVGLHRDVLPFLLDRARRCDMPYDIGALSAATRAFSDQNFVIFPNIAIQSFTESDIDKLDSQNRTRDVARIYDTYRWVAGDYVCGSTSKWDPGLDHE